MKAGVAGQTRVAGNDRVAGESERPLDGAVFAGMITGRQKLAFGQSLLYVGGAGIG